VTEVTDAAGPFLANWRTLMEIHPGIHHFNTGPFNWYVLEEAGRLTVVDTGFPGHYAVFREGLQTIGRSIHDVAAIVITHAHADHLGFAGRLRRETGVPVYIHEADRAAASRVLQLPWFGLVTNVWRPFTASVVAHAVASGLFRMTSVPETVGFRDGETLDVPGRLHVLHTPGHTPGEVVLYSPARGVLFSGDTLVTQNLLTGARGRPQVVARPLNADHQQARRTLDRLRNLGRVTLLPGHGHPWTGSIAEAIAAARG